MKLSVIVPSLTGQVPESLMRAVEGRTDVEVVVVKGVSPVGKARNEGLARAKGEYIAWVDADDEVTEGWLPSILTAISTGPDLVTFGKTFVGWGEDVRDFSWGETHLTNVRLMRAIYQGLELSCEMWIFVTRRELWKGLRFEERTAMAEDYVLAPRLLARAQTITYIQRKLYRYVCRETSLVHQYGFVGDVQVMELKRQRAFEAPQAYRRAAALGLAAAYYQVAIRVAHGFAEFQSAEWRNEARLARQFIRRHIFGVAAEVLFRTCLPLREKAKWIARFAWSCLPEGLGSLLVRRS